MPRVVVDTSALIDSADVDHTAWTQAIFRLQATHGIEAPVLLTSEASNVVHHKHPDVFGEDPAERAEFLELLLDGVGLVEVASDPDARHRLADLVAETGLTSYDTEFLELAERSDDGVLVSHDRPLREAAQDRMGEDRAMDLDGALARMERGEL